MSLWKIAWRSITQRALSSSLTAISMALGVTLVVAVLVAQGVIGNSFNNPGLGYDLIVGAKGGRLDLVLNAVYYRSRPVENIPYSYYKELTDKQSAIGRFVDVGIPLCLGDYYRDYRVIGTTPEMFSKLTYHNRQNYEFSTGRNFEQEHYFEGVIGAAVARETGLKVGDKFHPTHGVGGHEHDPFEVVGVLASTGTPNDRALFVNMEGFYLLDSHALPVEEEEQTEEAKSAKPASEEADQVKPDRAKPDSDNADSEVLAADEPAEPQSKGEVTAGKPAAKEGHEHAHHDHNHQHTPLPENQREVTAVMVRTVDIPGAPPGMFTPDLMRKINKGRIAQAVQPLREIATLFSIIVDPIQVFLLVITVLLVVVAGIGILVSIYNSMSERRHEIAVMRALGAGRGTVMLMVLLESILLALGGGALGWFLGHLLLAVLNPYIVEKTGVPIGFFHVVPFELVIIPGLILLASLVGYLPALAAYRTDVAKALTETP